MVNAVKRLHGRICRRRFRVRNRVRRDSTVAYRLSVFRSNNNIYAQVIDDTTHRTVCAASSLKSEIKGGDVASAAAVGSRIAELALDAGIQRVVFDRGCYKYHGRVAALADAARSAGLEI